MRAWQTCGNQTLFAAQHSLYSVQMARREVPLTHLCHPRLDLAAVRKAMRAPGMKWAAWRRVDGARRLSFQLDLAELSVFRVPAGDGRHQRLSVRVSRIVEQLGGGRRLHDVSEVHDHDPIAHVMYHVQVMGYEDERHVGFTLYIPEQVDDLALNRYVQR